MNRQTFALLLCSAFVLPAYGQDARPVLVPKLEHAPQSVRRAIVSDDGKWVVSAASEEVRLWNAETAQLVRVIPLPARSSPLCISSDAKWVVTGDKDAAELWDLSSGQKVRRFEGNGEITTACLSSDGKRLAGGTNGTTVVVWDLQAGKKLQTLTMPTASAHALKFTRDGADLLAACGRSGFSDDPAGCVVQWNIATGKETKRFAAKGTITSFDFSEDGKWLISAGFDAHVRVWDFTSAKERDSFKTSETLNSLRGVLGSKDGKWLIYVPSVATLRATGDKKDKHAFNDKDGGNHESLYLSKDEKTLVTASSWDVRLWDVESGKRKQVFDGLGILSDTLVVSGNGNWLALSSKSTFIKGDKTARLWNLATGRQVASVKHENDSIESVVLANDGMLVTGAIDAAKIWNPTSAKAVRSLDASVGRAADLALSDDGKTLITPDFGKRLFVWDLPSGKGKEQLVQLEKYLNALAITPDGSRLVVGAEREIAVWDLRAKKSLATFAAPDYVSALAVSHDGKWVATVESEKAHVLDASNGKAVHTFPAPQDSLVRIALSPDKRWLAAGGYGYAVHLWDLSGKEKPRSLRHSGTIGGLAFMPGSKILVTTGNDQTTRFWDIANGTELCRLMAFKDGTWAVTDSASRYDAANDGDIAAMHWVVGAEVHPLRQYRDRFYDPGVLAKHLGFDKTPLRQVKEK